MASFTVVDVKKALTAAGIEIYRTKGAEVLIADRVRENLIMDSRVSVSTSDPSVVRFVVWTERSAFPAEAASSLFDRARALAAGALAQGYVETGETTSVVKDPSDPAKSLDTWYEVVFEKQVSSLEEAVAEVRYAVTLDKAARG